MHKNSITIPSMNPSRSSFQASFPHSNYSFEDLHQERPSGFTACVSTCAKYFNDGLVTADDLDPLSQLLSPSTEQRTQANTLAQSYKSNTNFDTYRNSSQKRPTFGGAQLSTSRYDDGIPRGSDDDFPRSRLGMQDREAQGRTDTKLQHPYSSPFNARRRSHSIFSQKSRATPMPNLQTPSGEQMESHHNQFTPYRALFNSSTEARNHRHIVTRFSRQPYISPANDPAIGEIERDRQHHVGRIYCAMTRGDRAQDNPGSIAVKRWVHPGAHYKSDLVEAFAHKVFDCLLAQVKDGFRGWHHNDYVEDDRKGEKEDRDVDCLGRLNNIIDALEREKTICEDVVNSASQIRMFVNAPIAYAMRKYQNRVGNSKRGRTKETADSNSRPTKTRGTAARRARARSGTVSEIPASRDTTPQFLTMDTAASPYFLTPALQHSAPSCVSTNQSRQPPYGAAVSTSPLPIGYPHVNTLSPSMMPISATNQHMVSRPTMSPPCHPASQYFPQKPTIQASPLISPSPLSYAHYSVSLPTDDVRYQSFMDTPTVWTNTQSLRDSVCKDMDLVLPSSDDLFSDLPWSNDLNLTRTENSVKHCHHDPKTGGVSLADLEQPAEHGTYEFPNFETLWNNQPGVQQFSFQPRGDDQN